MIDLLQSLAIILLGAASIINSQTLRRHVRQWHVIPDWIERNSK